MSAHSTESFNPAALKAARQAAGWTMRQLANKIGQNHPTAICIYEIGKGKPSEKTLKKLAKALHVPVAQLTGGVVAKPGNNTSNGTPRGEGPSLAVRTAIDFLSRVAQMLVEKNAAYGDSAAHPRRVFSKADAVEQLLVRIDDKLSRISTVGFADSAEDSLFDLVGYLALLAAARKTAKRASAQGAA